MTACAGPRQVGGAPGLTVSKLQDLPTPSRRDLSANSRSYRIGMGDRLQIDVPGTELTREIQVGETGRFTLPMIGAVDASGKTTQELATTIHDRLQTSYIRDPQVTVTLKETLPQLITVDGEVREPGVYPVVGRMTLTRAIATAKGTGEFARLTDVLVLRTVDGQRLLGVYNLKAIRDGNYADPEVFADDLIEVGDSPGRRAFKSLLGSVPAFLTPLVYLLR